MSTWLAVIVETKSRAEFWDVAGRHGVRAEREEVPAHALIDCEASFDFDAPFRLAEAMSKDLGTTSIGFVMQTNSDVYDLRVFRDGSVVRTLTYSRDGGGWLTVEGTAQPWERAFFFDDSASTADDGSPWPDMLSDDLSDEDIAKYEAAKKAGDATTVLGLLDPSSTSPMIRVCDTMGIEADSPGGRWKKRSFIDRLLRRG